MSTANSPGLKFTTTGVVLGTANAANCSFDASSAVDAIALPNGTTVQRPTDANVANGMIRFNKSLNVYEAYFAANNTWVAWAGANALAAGANQQIQFNDGGLFGANTNLTFDKATSTFTANVANVYLSDRTMITGSAPRLDWLDAGAAVNNGTWRVRPVSGQLRFQVINDANNAAQNWLTVNRSAQVITSIALGNDTDYPTVSLNCKQTSINSNTTQPLTITSTVPGVYATWKSNNVAVGDVGSGDQLISGGSLIDFGIAGRGSGNVVIVTGVGSTERVRVLATGFVGVNTASPNNQFQIVSATDDAFRLQGRTTAQATYQTWYDSDGTRRGYFGYDATGINTITLVNEKFGHLRFGTNSSITSVDIDPAGNVGIGTASPTANLHVIGTVLANNQIQSTLSGGAPTSAFLANAAVAAYSWNVTTAAANCHLWDLGAGGAANTMQLRLVNDAAGAANVVWSITRAGIAISGLSWGNAVGDNPFFQFLGTGQASFGGDGSGFVVTPSLSLQRAGVTNFCIRDTTDAVEALFRVDSSGVIFGATSNNTLSIRTNNSNRVVIDQQGNVGINTTTPITKLDVRAGIITAGDQTADTLGHVLLQGYRSTNDALTVFGTQYSSGGPVIGYATKSNTTGTGFLSSYAASAARSAIVAKDGSVVFYTGGSQTVAVGSPVTMSEVMRIDNTPFVGVSGNGSPVTGNAVVAAGRASIVLGSATDAALIFQNTGAYLGGYIYSSNTEMRVFGATTSTLTLYAGSVLAATVATNTKVGFNCVPTAAQLSIHSDAESLRLAGSSDAPYISYFAGGVTGTRMGYIQFVSNSAAYFAVEQNIPLNIQSNSRTTVIVSQNQANVNGTLNVSNSITQFGDINANPSLTIHNSNTVDGRTVISFIQDKSVTQRWDIGIDPDGGATKNFSIRDITQNRIPLAIANTGAIKAPASPLNNTTTQVLTGMCSVEALTTTTNATLTNDNGLTVAVNETGSYAVELFMAVKSTGTGGQGGSGFNFDFGANTANIFRMTLMVTGISTNSAAGVPTTLTPGILTNNTAAWNVVTVPAQANGNVAIMVKGHMSVNAASAANVGIRWSQNNANSSNTTSIVTGSYLILTKIGALI